MPTDRHTPITRTGANHTATSARVRKAGALVRNLLEQGLTARARANRMGWTKCNVSITHFAMATVRMWLDRNPYPSAEALRGLLRDHWSSVRCMMPANAAGKRRLAEIETTIHTLTP